LLDGFEVPPTRIPASVDAQVALYRSTLAERRVLVVLDNARDAEQVRPLLPGAGGCLTVVTSRENLSGLVVSDGAVPVVLDLMPVDEARELIARRIGDRRAAAEPAAVTRIVERCARLPLALAVVAARAATHPRFALSAVAEELGSLGSLDVLGGPDVTTDVRAVLSWSYLQLSPEGARLFRLLGLHPGPDVTAPAVASLAGTSLPQARTVLAELARTNLVAENAPNRYRCHDLLRRYASELVEADDAGVRTAALHRMLDHYLHTAHRAAMLLNPNRHPITLAEATPGARPEPLADHDRALAWLTAERPVLVPVTRLAAAGGFGRHTWQLAWTLTTFLDRRGHWQDRVAVHERAVEAAGRLGDAEGLAYAHRGLGLAHFRLGRYPQARENLLRALEFFRERADRAGQAHTHLDLAWVCDRQAAFADALEHANRALVLHRAAGHRPGEASALNAVGWFHATLGERDTALARCEEAHGLFRRLGDRIGEAATWDSLGYVNHQLGRYESAIECYGQAVDLFREAGDRYHEAESLRKLSGAFLAAADTDHAYGHGRSALRILDELGHPDADEVRLHLAHLTSR
jgi:tetratricopeptide (TPR) repeat protein